MLVTCWLQDGVAFAGAMDMASERTDHPTMSPISDARCGASRSPM